MTDFDTTTLAPSLKTAIAADERKVDNLAHLTRLADGMTRNGQDCRDWVYEGEFADAGDLTAHCTCGHPIRYVFTIRNTKTGDALPIGSVCIDNSVPHLIAQGNETLAAALQAAVEKLRRDIEEAKRRERDAANDVIASALLAYAKELNDWRRAQFNTYRTRHAYAPEHIYRGFKVNVNSTPGRTVSGARKKIVTFLLAAVLEGRKDPQAKTFPAPPEAVRDDIRAALRKALDEADRYEEAARQARAERDRLYNSPSMVAFRERHGLS